MDIKIGDRVKTNFNGYRFKDKVGTVIGFESYDIGNCVLIEFDEHINGHTADGKGRDGHCWYIMEPDVFRVNQMEPIKKLTEFKFT